MNIRISFSALLIALISLPAAAQFQGQIGMNIYSENNGNKEVNEVNMYVTPERIFLKGQDRMSFTEGLDASGLLIRHDMKDFIVLMGEKEALQITKSEVEGLFDMFGMMNGNRSNVKYNHQSVEPGYRYTNETRTIMGYECAQMIVEDRSEDSNGSYLSIWLTPNIDINWGMLAEPWKNLPEEMDSAVNTMSQETIFQGKNFPMLIEAYDANKGEMIRIMEVTSINRSNVAKAMVQVPAGVNLMGISELMWKMMMNSGDN